MTGDRALYVQELQLQECFPRKDFGDLHEFPGGKGYIDDQPSDSACAFGEQVEFALIDGLTLQMKGYRQNDVKESGGKLPTSCLHL